MNAYLWSIVKQCHTEKWGSKKKTNFLQRSVDTSFTLVPRGPSKTPQFLRLRLDAICKSGSRERSLKHVASTVIPPGHLETNRLSCLSCLLHQQWLLGLQVKHLGKQFTSLMVAGKNGRLHVCYPHDVYQ